jgi:HK97 gp10 family phage protein
MSSGFTVDLSQLDGLRRDIREWGDDVKDQVAMAGAAGGARVLYNEAKARAPVSDEVHTFYGRASKRTGVTYTFRPGNLRDSIYRKFSPEYSSPTRKEYRISWNHFKAPYGHMVEFGTSKAEPHSFLGAALSALPEALVSAKLAMGAQLIQIQRR